MRLNRNQARLQLLNVNDSCQTPKQLAVALGALRLADSIDTVLQEYQRERPLSFKDIVSRLLLHPAIAISSLEGWNYCSAKSWIMPSACESFADCGVPKASQARTMPELGLCVPTAKSPWPNLLGRVRVVCIGFL